jgi:transposase
VGDDEIMKLYKQGVPDLRIAKILNVSRSYLFDWRRERNLPTNYSQAIKYDKEKFKTIALQGKTLDEMAEIFGVSRSTVYRWEMEMKAEGENEN